MAGVLVIGFGPFLDVKDNPAARIAQAIDGAQLPSGPVWGRVMDVSYERAPQQTLAWCDALSPSAVVGVGVARRRTVTTVETVGRRWTDGATRDVDGACPPDLEPGGPESVRLGGVPAAVLAAMLGGVVGEDAGRYVCNAWIYRTSRALRGRIPLTFLHIPPSGLQREPLVRALATWDPGGHHGLSQPLR